MAVYVLSICTPFVICTGQSFEQLCREKELPIVVSFWPRTFRSPRMSPATPPAAMDVPKLSISSTKSKRLSKGKFLIDGKSKLLLDIPDEMDRQYKVLRWPDLNDLLQKLLHPRPSMRPSAHQVLVISPTEWKIYVACSCILVHCTSDF